MTEKPPVRFQRANFVVADLDRALTFYEGVLGFEVTVRLGHNPDSYSFPVFDIPGDATLGFAILSLPGQPRVMALTEIGTISLAPVPHPRRGAIVLETQDPDEVMRASRALGLHVYEEEVLKTHDGRIGREIGIVDFDDNLVVIYLIPETAA
ncbi:VOC family protein [Altererythrobacter arenosus]|uniref:VOC family protein n=1 Tax=Altererythrobacter arenosus TaxID=3032592 RepID=A0ABY8FMU2_9SPHN|nr:VOC family protein [Altererythrobacter sp. CAU 1644]WFL76344.1 VOC family protein [Altererythrobacter sp. CAU 1644]